MLVHVEIPGMSLNLQDPLLRLTGIHPRQTGGPLFCQILTDFARGGRRANSTPGPARGAANKKTEDLSMDELELGFSTLTGESADDYCGLLSVTVTENNLRQLLHVAILTANELGTQMDRTCR